MSLGKLKIEELRIKMELFRLMRGISVSMTIKDNKYLQIVLVAKL
jgi:hypothetical protein